MTLRRRLQVSLVENLGNGGRAGCTGLAKMRAAEDFCKDPASEPQCSHEIAIDLNRICNCR